MVKLRKQSIGRYIQNCTVNTGSTEFWKTIKPLISDRSHTNDNITLMENGQIVDNANDLSDVMNSYFVNMAKDIGHVSINIANSAYIISYQKIRMFIIVVIIYDYWKQICSV